MDVFKKAMADAEFVIDEDLLHPVRAGLQGHESRGGGVRIAAGIGAAAARRASGAEVGSGELRGREGTRPVTAS